MSDSPVVPRQARGHRSLRAVFLLFGVCAAMLSTHASAVPSYSRQTGQECASCHVGAFGPQLTPYGMRFKLGGYVDSDGQSGKVPLSAMVIASWSRTALPDEKGRSKSHTNLNEASGFLAGKLTDHIGSFAQVTYDGVEHKTALDHVDVRFANNKTVAGKELTYGVSLNNAPTTADPFNTLPIWSFPYTEAAHGAGTGGAEVVGVGALEGTSLGASGYLFWDNHVYAELATYRTLSPSALSSLGVGRDRSPGILSGSAYWRLAYMADLKKKAWSAGVFGNQGTLRDRETDERVSRFKDIGVDGSYQYLGTRKYIGTVNGSFIRERDSVSELSTRQLKLNTSFYWNNTYGASAGYFRANTNGGIGNNSGYLLQADWTPWGKEDSWHAPWANLRLGIQYVHFNKFNDESGLPLKASDANSLNFFAWTAF